MNKVIQIAQLYPNSKFKNQQRGRIYFAKGCAPCLNGIGGGWRFRTQILMDKVKKRYVLGRTNGNMKNNKGHDTLSFHINPYFGCVTATQFNNRTTWIIEVK